MAIPATPIIWRVSDGRAGHDTQSIGLAEALQRRLDCKTIEFEARSLPAALFGLLAGRFPAGMEIPAPTFILGAGRRTHPDIVAARHCHGGHSIVLMRPSLPRDCFDLCLIPEHDQPRTGANVVMTRGAINRMRPGHKLGGQGLMLVGGPSRHHDWNEDNIITALERIITADTTIHWIVTDSPRTPAATSRRLARLPATEYRPFRDCRPGWLAGALAETGPVWVSEDSVSMIHEALTAGCHVGLLNVPRKHDTSRVTRSIDNLIRQGYVTPYSSWLQSRALLAPPELLQEADRCAAIIIERFLGRKT